MENQIWVSEKEYALMQEWWKKTQNDFLDKVRNMEWGVLALCLTLAESENFAKNNHPQTVQYMKDVAVAWEIIKKEKENNETS